MTPPAPLTCPRCSAALPAAPAGGRVTCPTCGATTASRTGSGLSLHVSVGSPGRPRPAGGVPGAPGGAGGPPVVLLTFIGLFFLADLAFWPAVGWALLAGIVFGSLRGWWRRSRGDAPTPEAPGASTPLVTPRDPWQEELADRQAEIRRRLTEVERGRADTRSLVERLERLRSKMATVDAGLYQGRIATIERAGDVLQRQIASDDKLLAGYRQTLDVIDIELETARTAALLPDSVRDTLLERFDELAAVEEANDELRRRIEADEEIERLLR